MIDKWKVLASDEPADRLRSDYGALALVFAEASGRLEIWTKALEGWNVQQSIVAERWVAQGKAKGLAEGEAKGLAEGEAKGVIKGRAEGKAELVVSILEVRFGPVPAELAAAILGTTDADRLDQFGRAAARANSLDEFRPVAGL